MDSPLKRFTATEKWDDKWFRALSPKVKLLWLYLLDHCDNAGVVDPDLMLASFQIGDTVNEGNIRELGDRLQTLENGKLWIPKFIRFQFGELNPESRVHASVIKLLSLHNIQYPINTLSIPYVNGMPTLKDKDKEKDIAKEKDYFKAFWIAYPRKTAKQEAIKAWHKIGVDDEKLAQILSAIGHQKKSEQWLKDNGKFIPYPATWLNQGRWEDEMVQIESLTKPKSTKFLGQWTPENPPKREDFPSDQSFESHRDAFESWCRGNAKAKA